VRHLHPSANPNVTPQRFKGRPSVSSRSGCVLVALLVAGWVSRVEAAEPTWLPDTVKEVGVRSDSSLHAHQDTTLVPDTTGRMSTPSLVGALDRHLDTLGYRSTKDLHWIDYRYLGGVLESFPGVFVRDQYGEGQYSQATFDGADWRSVAVSENGRPLNNPASGVYNLYDFTTEYADRIEVVTGPRAFLYGLNSTGVAVNLVTKNYNSNKAFTKLNYSEGAYGYSYVDGTFSQNISRKVNVTVGFQHQGTDGRFTNASDDTWNSREKIRYNISHDLNLIFSHYYTSAHTELYGGVDSQSVQSGLAFSNILATVRDVGAYEKRNDHDLDLSLVGTVLGDTSNVSTLTLYYSHALREYRDGARGDVPDSVMADHTSSWTGAQFTQNLDLAFSRFSAGGNVELRQIEGSPNLGRRRSVIGAAWAKEEFDLAERVILAGYARYDRYLHHDYAGYGTDITIRPTEEIQLTGGISSSRRVPNFQELYWSDSTVMRAGTLNAEQHTVVEVGATYSAQRLGSVQLAFFHRHVADPITFSPYSGAGGPFPAISIANGPTLLTSGLSARMFLRLWFIALEGSAEYLVQRSGGQTLSDFPKLSGNGGIYYWGSVLKGKLELKTGFKGRFALSYTGLAFNPEVIAYVPSRGPALGTNSSADFFLIAHLGDAYVHFMWENIANIQYISSPFFPGTERAIRFGISWEFLN